MRTICISGIGKGLGRALAEKYLGAGDYVVGTTPDGHIDFAHERLTVFELDFYRPETIDACIKGLHGLGKIFDIVINNAGVRLDEHDDMVILEKLRATLEVNLFGHIQITEALLDCVAAGGHIINISSSAGSLEHTARPMYPSYRISKAALNMYTRTLALRLGDAAIVSSIHPGKMKTDMGDPDADITAEIAAKHIFDFSESKVESGQFWFNGKRFSW